MLCLTLCCLRPGSWEVMTLILGIKYGALATQGTSVQVSIDCRSLQCAPFQQLASCLSKVPQALPTPIQLQEMYSLRRKGTPGIVMELGPVLKEIKSLEKGRW